MIVDDQPDQIRFTGEILKVPDTVYVATSEKGHSIFLKLENLI